MLSVQRILGRPKQFFGLLQQSASLGAEAASALRSITANHEAAPPLHVLQETRRKDKQVIGELEKLLAMTFVTPIEREDIEVVAQQLYRIPKKIEKFAEIYAIVAPHDLKLDLTIPVQMLESAARIVLEMTIALSKAAKPASVKALDARLSQLEADSGAVISESLRKLYVEGRNPLHAIMAHDLFRALTTCIDACRSSGRCIALVTLKNS